MLRHSPAEVLPGCLQARAVRKKAAINIHVQVLCECEFSFGSVLGSTTAESEVKRKFSFARHGHTVFQSSCSVLHRPAVSQSSCCSLSSTAFGDVGVLGCGHSNRRVVLYTLF